MTFSLTRICMRLFLYQLSVYVHKLDNCINIVTNCVIICWIALCWQRAILGVELHFKVLLCNDQENIFA